MKVFPDVDGVLIHGWHEKPEHRRPWDATIEQDLGISREEFQRKFFGTLTPGYNSIMHACVGGDLDLKEALSGILPSLGYENTVDRFVEYWFTNDSVINADVIGAVARLAKFSHVELYLATGQEHYRANYLWNDLGFEKFFEEIFSAKLGYLKNTPDFFETINKMLEITPPERPLYFDDQVEFVTLAREAGWDAYLFETAEDLLNHRRIRELLTEQGRN